MQESDFLSLFVRPIEKAGMPYLVAGSVERFMDSRSRWAEIAQGGREWALEHYSPAACARRLMRVMPCGG